MRYQRKLSGPIMDRIDMWLEVTHIEHEKLNQQRNSDESKAVLQRVRRARDIQKNRFKAIAPKIAKNATSTLRVNSDMNSRELLQYVPLSESIKEKLNAAAKRLDLSPRAYHRIIKLARTIADLDSKESVEESHILEAIQYRPKKL